MEYIGALQVWDLLLIWKPQEVTCQLKKPAEEASQAGMFISTDWTSLVEKMGHRNVKRNLQQFLWMQLSSCKETSGEMKAFVTKSRGQKKAFCHKRLMCQKLIR